MKTQTTPWPLVLLSSVVGLMGWGLAAEAWSRTYYVAPTGQDAQSCTAATHRSAPKQSLQSGLTCLTTPGDTLMLRAGRYVEALRFLPGEGPAPTGTSWEAPLTIQAAPEEHVVLAPVSGEAVLALLDPQVQFLRVHGLELDASNVTAGIRVDGPHALHVEATRITGALGAGLHLTPGTPSTHEVGPDLRFTQLDVQQNTGHGIQAEGLPFVLEDSTIHHNGGHGIQSIGGATSPPPGRLRVWKNRLWQNGLTQPAWGLQLDGALPTVVYGNVVQQHTQGLRLSGSSTASHLIVHNTIVGPGEQGLVVQGTHPGLALHNNLSVQHAHNIVVGPEVQGTVSHNGESAAGFVDLLQGDVHLTDESPAIDAGLPMPALLAVVPGAGLQDHEGQARPQGEGWDLGAYEHPPLPPEAPRAAFVADPVQAVPPAQITFLDQSTGVITQWQWAFGDGATSQTRHPTHTYRRAGAYPVTLTVTGPGGTQTVTQTALVTIRSVALHPTFALTPTQGPAPLTVAGTNTSMGDILRYQWDWGDGTRSQTRQPAHTFTQPGVYRPQLTIHGFQGETAAAAGPDAIVVLPPVGPTLFAPEWLEQGLDPWEVVDEGTWQGPSHWAIQDGVLTQSRNIWSPPSVASEVGKRGTMLWYRPGATWRDYRLRVAIQSTDDDAVGVLFRYQDPDHYYRVSWDEERGYRRLVKCVDGQFVVLAEEPAPARTAAPAQVQIEVFGPTIRVMVNEQVLFGGPRHDISLAEGSVGLYTWFNNQSQFATLEVQALRMPTPSPVRAEGRTP